LPYVHPCMRGWAKNFTRVSPLFGFFSKTTAYKLLPSHACLSSPLFLSLLAREGRWIRVLFCTLWNCEGRQRTVSVVVTAVHCSFHGPPSSHSAALCCVARSCSLLSLSFLVGYYYLAVLVFFFFWFCDFCANSLMFCRPHKAHTHIERERGELKAMRGGNTSLPFPHPLSPNQGEGAKKSCAKAPSSFCLPSMDGGKPCMRAPLTAMTACENQGGGSDTHTHTHTDTLHIHWRSPAQRRPSSSFPSALKASHVIQRCVHRVVTSGGALFLSSLPDAAFPCLFFLCASAAKLPTIHR
jgi:hypothetical protein